MSYNKKEIASGFIREIAGKLSSAGLISREQLDRILADFKSGFYTPSLFVRIGLFIFTMVMIDAAIGIVGLTIYELINGETMAGVLALIGAACFFAILEYFINTKHHYRSGIDDCLLYTGTVFLIAGIVLITQLYEPLQICLLVFPVLLIAAWRYADALLSVLAFICFYISLFLVLKDNSYGRVWMPFIFMGVSGLLLFLFNSWLRKESSYYYDLCLRVLKVASLLTCYLSMNYFVVKEGNMLLNDTLNGMEPYSDIPLAFLFLAVTCILPVVYLIFGLKLKDRLLIRTGLGVLLLTLLTLKYRYINLEYAYLMTWTGMFLLIGSWIGIQYLKANQNKYTYASDDTGEHENLINAEAMLISQTTGSQTPLAPDEKLFGGGSFGGGGAGGNV